VKQVRQFHACIQYYSGLWLFLTTVVKLDGKKGLKESLTTVTKHAWEKHSVCHCLCYLLCFVSLIPWNHSRSRGNVYAICDPSLLFYRSRGNVYAICDPSLYFIDLVVTFTLSVILLFYFIDLGVKFTLSVILLFYFIDLGVTFTLSVILLFYFIDLGVMFTLSVILLFYFIDLGALKIRGTYRKASKFRFSYLGQTPSSIYPSKHAC